MYPAQQQEASNLNQPLALLSNESYLERSDKLSAANLILVCRPATRKVPPGTL